MICKCETVTQVVVQNVRRELFDWYDCPGSTDPASVGRTHYSGSLPCALLSYDALLTCVPVPSVGK